MASLMHASVPLKKYFRVTDQPPSCSLEFFPVLRQLNGIVAGALGMSWWRFLLFNAIGAALWVGAWVFIATYFSAHAAATAHFANKLIFAAVALGLVILLVRLVVRRLRRDLD